MIVVACPRSGTTSLAKMFGFPHESRFTIGKPPPDVHELKVRQVSEVSWLAAPNVPEMLAAGVPLLHVVRHPLRVIASLCAMDFWTTKHKAYREFVISNVPACVGKSPEVASAFLWLRWNAICKGVPRVRIEDIVGAPRLNEGLHYEVAWKDIEDSRVREAVLNVSVDYGYGEGSEYD